MVINPEDSGNQDMLEELLRLYSDLALRNDELAQRGLELASRTDELGRRGEELEALSDAKSQILGVVAHDLRGPLGVIRSYADFLLEGIGASLSPSHREALAIIHEQSAFLLRLVGDLLDFSAIESGKLELRLFWVDMRPVIERAVQRNRILAEPKRISVRIAEAPASTMILCDSHRIEQVLNNLISNAVKFSPAGAFVEVTVERGDEGLLVRVEDNGPGIAPEEMCKLFQPFQRLSAANSEVPGTGLGLAICRKIVEAHGGRIWAEARPGGGLRFMFQLPAGA
jgi:two-component system OmpR family sensor kinase